MDNPLHYFVGLLEYNKTEELKNQFITMFKEHGDYASIIDINENGNIEYHYLDDNNVYHKSCYKFEKEFNRKVTREYKKAKKSIDKTVHFIAIQGNIPTQFLELQISILKSLHLKYDKIYITSLPIIKNALIVLNNHISDIYNITTFSTIQKQKTIPIKQDNPDGYSPLSFCWDSLNPEYRLENLNHLYDLLTANPPVIQCSQEEFINAFSQKKVKEGINRLVIAKNKHTSKSTLFYFIHFLNNEGYIASVNSTELNKKVEYIFRDAKGNRFKNVRQSKSYSSKTPEIKEYIDTIFKQLHQ